MTTTTLIARYAGACTCGAEIHKGDTIQYSRAKRAVVGCPKCRDKRAEGALADAFDRAYEDQCAAACGPGL